jgi:hypothetical protein
MTAAAAVCQKQLLLSRLQGHHRCTTALARLMMMVIVMVMVMVIVMTMVGVVLGNHDDVYDVIIRQSCCHG